MCSSMCWLRDVPHFHPPMGRLRKLSTSIGICMCYGGDLPSWEVGKDHFSLYGCLISCNTCERSEADLCPLWFVPPSANINGPRQPGVSILTGIDISRHKGVNLFSYLYLDGLHLCYTWVNLKSRLQLMADQLLLWHCWSPMSPWSTHWAVSALSVTLPLQPERRH